MSAGDDEQLRQRVERLERQLAELQAQLQQSQRPAAPEPEASPPPPRRDLEAHLGSYWLSRAGILALITGLALLVTYRFEDLGPLLRVALGYGLALGLAV